MKPASQFPLSQFPLDPAPDRPRIKPTFELVDGRALVTIDAACLIDVAAWYSVNGIPPYDKPAPPKRRRK